MIYLAIFLIIFIGIAISLVVLNEFTDSIWMCEQLHFHIPKTEEKETTCKRCGCKLRLDESGEYQEIKDYE